MYTFAFHRLFSYLLPWYRWKLNIYYYNSDIQIPTASFFVLESKTANYVNFSREK